MVSLTQDSTTRRSELSLVALPLSEVPAFTLSWRQLSLLKPYEQLSIEVAERSLTLRRGRLVLARAAFTPAAFRLLLVLLLAQGRTLSYGALLAARELSEEELVELLEQPLLQQQAFGARARQQEQALQAIRDAADRERSLKPLRRLIRERPGLTRLLAGGRFPWEIEVRYGRGYKLARLGS